MNEKPTTVEILNKYYSHLSEDEQMRLVWNATAYPFGDNDYFEKQLRELKENTDGSLEDAIRYAHEQMDKDFDKLKAENPDIFK